VDVSGLPAGVIGLTESGGAGNDTLIGSQGDDTFVWNPGDGSDVVEGQGGRDTLVFNGSEVAERFDLSANGTRARLTRDLGGSVDLGGVEAITVNPLGGADTVTVNDLTGTAVTRIDVNLAEAVGGAGDGQADTVIVNGTNGSDNINLVGGGVGAPVVNVFGLSALVSISNSDGPGDSLVINTLGGNDTVDASGLPAGLIGLTVNLGDGQGDANARFVDQLYQDLLGRQAEPAGLALWKGQVDQGLMTRAQVAAGIAGSPEYLTGVVQKAYEQFLHRAGDPGGVAGWVQFLQAGHTIEQMESGIVGSPEYFQVRGGGTNAGFLTALYRDALGRAPDAGGLAGFTTALTSGSTTGQVAALIFASREFQQDLVGGFYATLLGRAADNGGLNGFVTAMQNGATDEQVIAAIAASDEFFANL
jgi:hypothetical protein